MSEKPSHLSRQEQMKENEQEFREKLLNLAREVIEDLKKRKLCITTVESCTGGALVSTLTNIPGASEVIKDSFVVYSNEAKIKLGVPPETIEKHTVYSLEVAEAMARAGLEESVRAEIGVGITGSITRVDPFNPETSQPGVVYIAVVSKNKKNVEKYESFQKDASRSQIKEEFVYKALELIKKNLTEESNNKL